jgi:hypothetical protein
MPRNKHISLLLFVVVACSPLPNPAAGDSGVEGQVLLGPTCPVVQVGKPCPDRPYSATLIVLTLNSGGKVTQVEADANGLYHIVLPPGQYVLHPESTGGLPRASDVPFLVEASRFTRLDIVYDSGIR